jgi:hypothetical protein
MIAIGKKIAPAKSPGLNKWVDPRVGGAAQSSAVP